MNELVKKVFDQVISENPDLTYGHDMYIPPRTSKVCLRCVVLTEKIKRGISVCMSDEYIDDHLNNEDEIDKSVAIINKKLSELRENAKHQTKQRVDEEDFILTSYP